MKIETIVPLSLRRIKHNGLGNYAGYLDELIGRKLEELRKRKELGFSKRYRRLAVGA